MDSFEGALRALDRVPALDRRAVRASFERGFTARRMARDYLRIYDGLLEAQQRALLERQPENRLLRRFSSRSFTILEIENKWLASHRRLLLATTE